MVEQADERGLGMMVARGAIDHFVSSVTVYPHNPYDEQTNVPESDWRSTSLLVEGWLSDAGPYSEAVGEKVTALVLALAEWGVYNDEQWRLCRRGKRG